MAEQVARLKILAQIEGLEGFDKLKGAFKGLQQAIGPSDQQLSKARREILAFGQAGEKTEQVIRGQIEALKALQGQASVSGTAYKQLGRDIQQLSSAYKEAATGVKQFTDAQLKSQIVGSKPGTFDKQIAALRRDLQELKVYSREYTDTLTEIQRRQLPFNTALGRQNVIAGFETFRQGGKGGATLPELPNTTAGLQQRLNELNEEFTNLTRGGEDWIRVSRQIANVQRQLNQEFSNPAVEAARRRLEASRNTSSGFLAFSEGLEDRLAIQKSIARNQRRQAPAALELPVMETSELYRSIEGVGLSRIGSQLELMGNSYETVAADIRKATAASDGSINSLRSQRAAWEGLRNAVGANSPALKQIEKELAAVDRQLEKRTGDGGGIGQRIQAAGAIASGAIFGGPLGAAGGLIGAGVGAATGIGAVGGAFAGAAIGGAAGVFQQQITAATDYAGEIARLQIALKGVSTDQKEFNNSLQFISQSSGQFLTSLGDATRNYTKLQASIRGAGKGTDETQTVFKGLSAAIIATGGSTESLNAAFTAATQVFSKGKVSAEELRGQIGERLPGAFTIFAQAVGKTPQQLDEALQKGEVSLEDFVKFSQELFKRYGQAAQDIGDSPFAASIRFQLAMKNMQLAAGQALLPIATYFTNLGTEALNGLTRVFEGTTQWQQSLGNTFDNVKKLIGGVAGLKQILVGLTQTLVVLGTTMAAVFAVQNIGTFVTAFRTVATVTQGLVKVTKELLTLEKAMTALKGIQAGLQAIISAAGSNLKKNPRGVAGAVAAVGVGAIAATQFKDDFEKAIDGIFDSVGGKFNEIFKTPELGGSFGGTPPPNPGGGDGSGEGDKDAERRAAEQQRLNEETARAETALNDAVHRAAMDLIRKRYEFEQELINKQRDNWVKSLTGAAKTAGGLIVGFYGQLDELTGRQRQAAMDVANAQQAQRSAQAMAAVTGGGAAGSAGQIIEYLTGDRSHSGYRADHGGSNYHEHVAFQTAQQMRAAMEALRAAGITIGSTTGGRHAPGSYHYSGQAFDVPASQVPVGQEQALSQRVRQVLAAAGFTGAGIGGGAPTGAAAQQRRAVRTDAKASVESVEVQSSMDALALTNKQAENLRAQLQTGFVLDFTEQLREQNAELKNNAEINALRNRLQMEGVRSEVIDNEVRKAEAAQRTAAANATAADALAKLDQSTEKGKETAQALRDAMASNNEQLAIFKTRTDEATAAQIAFNDAMRFRQDDRIGLGLREGAQQYVDSIGTMREATAQLAQNGIKGVEDAIFSLVTTGKANFKEFAAEMLKQTSRMIIQQLILRTIMQAIGLIGGGGGSSFAKSFEMPGAGFPTSGFSFAKGGTFANGIKPFAMGGIVDKPTLFKFANGGMMNTGLMGEAGPEAIIPLRRGRDGKLGVSAQGGGGTSVTVNVDASGGTQVSGNANQAEALGRAVSQAVQNELIRQKRPGGLLAA